MIEIENKPMQTADRTGSDYRAFLEALKTLETGQSFLTKIGNRDRVAMTIAGILLDRRFITRKEGEKYRVGRVL